MRITITRTETRTITRSRLRFYMRQYVVPPGLCSCKYDAYFDALTDEDIQVWVEDPKNIRRIMDSAFYKWKCEGQSTPP